MTGPSADTTTVRGTVVVPPSSSVTVTDPVYVPTAAYRCDPNAVPAVAVPTPPLTTASRPNGCGLPSPQSIVARNVSRVRKSAGLNPGSVNVATDTSVSSPTCTPIVSGATAGAALATVAVVSW